MKHFPGNLLMYLRCCQKSLLCSACFCNTSAIIEEQTLLLRLCSPTCTLFLVVECILALFQFLGRSSEMPSRLSQKNLHAQVMRSFCISARDTVPQENSASGCYLHIWRWSIIVWKITFLTYHKYCSTQSSMRSGGATRETILRV